MINFFIKKRHTIGIDRIACRFIMRDSENKTEKFALLTPTFGLRRE